MSLMYKKYIFPIQIFVILEKTSCRMWLNKCLDFFEILPDLNLLSDPTILKKRKIFTSSLFDNFFFNKKFSINNFVKP